MSLLETGEKKPLEQTKRETKENSLKMSSVAPRIVFSLSIKFYFVFPKTFLYIVTSSSSKAPSGTSAAAAAVVEPSSRIGL